MNQDKLDTIQARLEVLNDEHIDAWIAGTALQFRFRLFQTRDYYLSDVPYLLNEIERMCHALEEIVQLNPNDNGDYINEPAIVRALEMAQTALEQDT
jgi:hypothetical protein